jgi:hypothetical protein
VLLRQSDSEESHSVQSRIMARPVRRKSTRSAAMLDAHTESGRRDSFDSVYLVIFWVDGSLDSMCVQRLAVKGQRPPRRVKERTSPATCETCDLRHERCCCTTNARE